jgi:hypothetical protein
MNIYMKSIIYSKVETMLQINMATQYTQVWIEQGGQVAVATGTNEPLGAKNLYCIQKKVYLHWHSTSVDKLEV